MMQGIPIRDSDLYILSQPVRRHGLQFVLVCRVSLLVLNCVCSAGCNRA